VTWAAFVTVVSVDGSRGEKNPTSSATRSQALKINKSGEATTFAAPLKRGEGDGPAYLGHGYLEIQAGGGGVPLYLEPSKNVHHAWLRRRALWCQRDQEIVLVVRGVRR
jgi:hypothetical protein